MTQAFDDESGRATPISVVDVSENYITKVEELSGNTYLHIGKDKKVRNTRKSDVGNYKELGFVPVENKVFKVEGEKGEEKAGDIISADLFSVGDIVDVTGTSKGKGFAGVMKRWNFKGGKATHGQSDRDRAPGSIGSGTTPGRVYKGKKMAGRMGNEKVTVQNLKIVDVDTEKNLLLIAGAIPGNKKGYVIVRESFMNTFKKDN